MQLSTKVYIPSFHFVPHFLIFCFLPKQVKDCLGKKLGDGENEKR